MFVVLANPDGDMKPFAIVKLEFDKETSRWLEDPSIEELVVDDCNDTNTDALWFSFLVDPDLIILNIPIYGLKIYDLDLNPLKGLIPTEVNEFFLDFDLFPDLNDDWLLVAEIDRSDEKIDQSSEKPPNIYKEDRDEGGFT